MLHRIRYTGPVRIDEDTIYRCEQVAGRDEENVLMQNDDSHTNIRILGKMYEAQFWLVDAKVVFIHPEAAKELYPILTGQENIEEPFTPLPLEQIRKDMLKELLSVITLEPIDEREGVPDKNSTDQTVAHLSAALQIPNEEMRIAAVKELGTITDKSALAPLFRALRDASSYVRQEAAIALAHSNDPCVITELAQCLIDEIAAQRLYQSATRATQPPDLNMPPNDPAPRRNC